MCRSYWSRHTPMVLLSPTQQTQHHCQTQEQQLQLQQASQPVSRQVMSMQDMPARGSQSLLHQAQLTYLTHPARCGWLPHD